MKELVKQRPYRTTDRQHKKVVKAAKKWKKSESEVIRHLINTYL